MDQVRHRLYLGDPIEGDRDIVKVLNRHDEVHDAEGVHVEILDNVCLIRDFHGAPENLLENRGDFACIAKGL